ncbi:hypothetical protein D9757_006578 [Collybiopsis confluens]|uniref:Laccase n=1 Tax=Collybiopsis confluens TaxID=2823264 RepID=A0A8H5HQP0_9AGAR|nr:hypothetical protein D9757_006578 [Collybiopsis confluens]
MMLLSAAFLALKLSLLGTYAAMVVRTDNHEHPSPSTTTTGSDRYINLHIVNQELAPDGFKRSTVLAGESPSGGSFPGPLITGTKGDRFIINVTDQLTDPTMDRSTSIHWHGLFQKTTNYADGVAFVSQCPIVTNHSFVYDFRVPDQAGTFCSFVDDSFHLFEGTTLIYRYGDGLRGPLIIYDPQDPHKDLYDVDDESTVITIADWFHQTSLQLLAAKRAPDADATLINGKGRFVGGPDVPLTVIQVDQGKRYRFRLISMSFDAFHGFSIDNHNLTIIEVDGINTNPLTVTFIELYPAQRYSFVLDASQKVDNYRIRALASSGVGLQNFTGGINSGILRYTGAPDEEPTSSALSSSEIIAFHEANLHPAPSENPGAPGLPYPGGADIVLNLNLGFNAGNVTFSINDTSFVPPSVPVLLQILSGAQDAHDLLPKGGVITLERNKVVEVNLIGGNAPGGPHPFHLHGHAFDVIKTFDSPDYNFVNPIRRDVTPVAQGGLTVFRFVTDNPGPWFLHCHIDLHLALGLAVVFAEDTRDTKVDDPVPLGWKELCPIYDSLTPDQLR